MDDHMELPQNSASHSVHDDWSLIASPAERRKRQNRINQRIYRRRHPKDTKPTRWRLIGSLISDSENSPSCSRNPTQGIPATGHRVATSNIAPCAIKGHTMTASEYTCSLAPKEARKQLKEFQAAAYQSYFRGTPTADHRLTLVKVNVYRALVENLAALGMDMGWMKADSISPFCTLQPGGSDLFTPAHLQPTAIQRQVPHHPWLDFFPHPRMRDCLISAGDFDDEELCVDIMGFWTGDRADAGLIIWGQPWVLQNWELSEGFVNKWGWAIQDCPELLTSSNYWRTLRGEKRLPPLCQLGTVAQPTVSTAPQQ